jgi:hypothetical protein
MIEFINNVLTFPWWVFHTFFIYGFGLVVYWSIFEVLRHYRPWERFEDLPNYRDLFNKEKK